MDAIALDIVQGLSMTPEMKANKGSRTDRHNVKRQSEIRITMQAEVTY